MRWWWCTLGGSEVADNVPMMALNETKRSVHTGASCKCFTIGRITVLFNVFIGDADVHIPHNKSGRSIVLG